MQVTTSNAWSSKGRSQGVAVAEVDIGCQPGGDGAQLRSWLQANHAAAGYDAAREVAGDDARAAADVEHVVTRMHLEQVEVGGARGDLLGCDAARFDQLTQLARTLGID